MQKLFYGTWAFFGKMLKLPSVVVCPTGGGGGGGVELCNRDTPAPTARAPTGLLQNRLNDTFTTHKIKVYIHNKTI